MSETHPARSKKEERALIPSDHYQFDVAISYANEDFEQANAVAEALRFRKVEFFFDVYRQAALWGENLFTHLSEIYQNRARYCIVFCSKHYAEKVWTKHELRAAQARALRENEPYILPVRLDDTEIEGILPTIGHQRWSPNAAETIANIIVEKLGREPYVPPPQPTIVNIAATSQLKAPTIAFGKSGKGREIDEDVVLQTYLKKIEKTYLAGNATELTYRSALEDLLQKLAPGIAVTHEPKRQEYGTPDYVISRSTGHGPLNIGYLEAKRVDMDLDDIVRDAALAEPKTHDGKQFKKFHQALDNLVLTNYREFRWYLHGNFRMTAHIISPVFDKGIAVKKKAAKKNSAAGFTQLLPDFYTPSTVDVAVLLTGFLTYSTEPIRNPKELAERMARIAHIIRDMCIVAFDEGEISDILSDLYAAFKQVLIPDLTIPEFADMFAQTLAYGLFAARYNHTGSTPFSRQDAAREIPNTNPFLADLFEKITGRALDSVPFVGFVDDLAQLLAQTDMNAVLADFGKHTRREDPLVHFYETFLAQYDPKMREMRGVYYTPEPVVSYIVRSVDQLLRTHFDCQRGLADISTFDYTNGGGGGGKSASPSEPRPRVLLLDPACGTGTFLYAVINHIREAYRESRNAGMWSSYVCQHLLPRLFGFELLMAPYAMAHLKLGMQLAGLDLPEEERQNWAYDFKSKERLGLYLTNTLEEAVKRSEMLFARSISDEANAAAEIKRDLPIMVVLGNPPYSGHSANRSWETRDGEKVLTFIGRLLQDYYKVDGQPLGERNSKWLQDDYVKFIRFGQWRIEQTEHGILAFITNHGYLDNPTFRGMRQNLMQSFDEIYVLNLHGNSKKKERSPDGTKDENVFDIQQGVVISLFVKLPGKSNPSRLATVYHTQLWGPRAHKYHWLSENDVKTTDWVTVKPQAPFYLFMPQDNDLRTEYGNGQKITEIMPVNVMGFQTHRDHFAIDFNKDDLFRRINEMRDKQMTDQEYAVKYHITDNRDWKLTGARKLLRMDNDWKSKFIECSYRPFDQRFCYFSEVAMDYPRRELMVHVARKENLCLLSSRQQATPGYKHAWVTRDVANDCVVSTTSREANQVFPLYLYPETSKKGLFDVDEVFAEPEARIPNFPVAFINMLKEQLGIKFIRDGKGNLYDDFGPEDIFDYMYSMLYSPVYRERYAEPLKTDFPHLPFTSNISLFRKLCSVGDRLVALHLMEQSGQAIPPYPAPGNDVVEGVEYTPSKNEPGQDAEKGRVWINKAQYFEGVSPEVWEFHVGGYQVCQKWLKDRKGRSLSFEDIEQYQQIVAALAETITLMKAIDEVIDEHGGWPVQ